MAKRRRPRASTGSTGASTPCSISENEILWSAVKVEDAKAQTRVLDEQMKAACAKMKQWLALETKLKEAREAQLRTEDKAKLWEQREKDAELCAQEYNEAKQKADQAVAHLEEARAEEDAAKRAVRELRSMLELDED